MKRALRVVGAVLAVLCPAAAVTQAARRAVLPQYAVGESSVTRRSLPVVLAEVSGLATTSDGRLFAHADERAEIFELDPRTGAIRKQFSLGRPTARDDFEGIAIAGERIFLITSNGVLYVTKEGRSGEAVTFQRFDTGSGPLCEVEGLAWDAAGDRLLLPCKQARRRELRGRLIVLSVPLRTLRVEAEPALSIAHAQLRAGIGRDPPRATSVEVHPQSGSWLLTSSNPGAVIEVDADGALLAIKRLPAALHPQPESIAFTRDLTLVIADEGQRGAGTFALYPLRRSP